MSFFNLVNSDARPMSFRLLNEIQSTAQERRKSDDPTRWDQRIKSLNAGTVVSVLTLSSRVGRIAYATVSLFPKIAYSLTAGSRAFYDVNGATKEIVKRYVEEWMDLVICLPTIPIAFANAVKPSAFEKTIDNIDRYYAKRQLRREKFDAKWAFAKAKARMPMSIRILKNMEETLDERELFNNPKRWDLRLKALYVGTIASFLTLEARIFRIAFETLFLVPKVVCSSIKGSKVFYNVPDAAEEVFKCYQNEWLDLFYTLKAESIALNAIIWPFQLQDIKVIERYYNERNMKKDIFDIKWKHAKATWQNRGKQRAD